MCVLYCVMWCELGVKSDFGWCEIFDVLWRERCVAEFDVCVGVIWSTVWGRFQGVRCSGVWF